MTRLPDLERSLVAAAARLDAPTTAAASSPRGRLRRRWRDLGRSGRSAGVLAGALLLGTVATGSAQIAGLDPWGKLVGQDRIDPALRPTSTADGSVGVRAPDAPGAPGWELRAYVARNGKLCLVAAGRGGEGLYSCWTSDRAAALLAGRPRTGQPLAGVAQTGPPSFSPTHLVAWALTDWSAPPARFVAPAGASVRVIAAARPLRLEVDHSPGLSRRGDAVVAALPRQITLRLTVANISRRTPLTTHGDAVAITTAPAVAGGATSVLVTSATAWARSHTGRTPWQPTDDEVLDRGNGPVSGPTEGQLKTFPELGRPRTPADVIPADAVTWQLRSGRIQPAASRLLGVTGTGNLGRIWLAPGAIPDDFTVPTVDGQICLAGPVVLSHCQATSATGTRPDPEAVVCASGLPAKQLLVWAFVPDGADHVRVDHASGSSATYATADLLVLLQPRTAPLPTTLTWTGPNGFRAVDRVVFPPNPTAAVCGHGQAPHYWELRQSASSSAESHH